MENKLGNHFSLPYILNIFTFFNRWKAKFSENCETFPDSSGQQLFYSSESSLTLKNVQSCVALAWGGVQCPPTVNQPIWKNRSFTVLGRRWCWTSPKTTKHINLTPPQIGLTKEYWLLIYHPFPHLCINPIPGGVERIWLSNISVWFGLNKR